ncbi:MAG: signal recognition particle protein [Armatimonadetes bacterium]|nr:signal recognition particle protein [Armatimonadota bacterium]MDW8121447.1 signal recognition particle protein [Armatimonadota bacterium]
MWKGLTDRLSELLGRFRGKGRISQEELDNWLRDVRRALLEADVSLSVCRHLVSQIGERARTPDVLEHPAPLRRLSQILYEELVRILGEKVSPVTWAPRPPTIWLLMGLQGSGKTTTAGKLASLYKKQGRKPLLVPADLKRPAASEQLRQIAEQVGVAFFPPDSQDLSRLCQRALRDAQDQGWDLVIVDSAGRMHSDEALMEELAQLKRLLQPHESLLVLDATTGQDAVRLAESFDSRIGLTGVILTKLDSDARGGAVLSVTFVTGKPVKFIGTGEHLQDIDLFHPDRMAARILGMGDVRGLLERVEQIASPEIEKIERRLEKGTFGLDDLLVQLREMRKIGPLDRLLSLLPGLGGFRSQSLTIDEKSLKRTEAIILSMTPEERRNPEIISGSRKKRIARGSGTTVQQVNELLKHFKMMRDTMKRLAKAKVSDEAIVRLLTGMR